jgi:ABC-2 type transport system ATP-binding protein
VGWLEGDEHRTVLTAEPTRTVQDLSARFDGEVPGLSVARPTLEDVYLRLIGESDTVDRTEPR